MWSEVKPLGSRNRRLYTGSRRIGPVTERVRSIFVTAQFWKVCEVLMSVIRLIRIAKRGFCAAAFGSLYLQSAVAVEEFSQANQLLFETDHLGSISEPATLHYAFRKSSTVGDGFQDTIDVKITEVKHDGSKNVQVHYLTGDRRRYAPDVPNALGNPVVILYLQRDVNEMGRATPGNWRYFQRRIKRALAATDEVKTVKLSLNGRDIPGRRIKIEPYRDDRQKDQLQDYVGKYYVFTLAPDVPGYIYEIKSVVPSQTIGAQSVIEESLQYTGITRGTGPTQ